jgi:DNA-binding NarL/FixJ family response regulator
MTSPHSPYKVIIVEDHLLFADGLEQLLNADDRFEVLAKVANGKVLMQTLNRISPDLVLLDINMPLMDGLETAIEIRRRQPGAKIVFVSMKYDPSIKSFIHREGVDGYIIKETAAPEFKAALMDIMAGKKTFLFPPEASAVSRDDPAESDFMKSYKLTPTEIAIIGLIATGDSTKVIAAKRQLSPLTVESHRKNIFRKLKAKNMAEVVAFAIKNGLSGDTGHA